VLAIREQVLGPEHPDTAISLNGLAALLDDMGGYGAARPLYERALAIYEQALGPEHPNTAASLNGLAALLHLQGEYGAARPLFERALAIYEQALGPEHPDLASSCNYLAVLLLETGEIHLAQPYIQRACAIRPQHNLDWYWQALILLANYNTHAASTALERSYHLADQDDLVNCITHFWRGVIADLDNDPHQTQTAFAQAEQVLASLSGHELHKLRGLIAAQSQDIAAAQGHYQVVLADQQQLGKLTSHRIYLGLLARLFPDRAAFHDTHTWLATELRQRMVQSADG
jgi:tetratricopeptide (TPR) repeat protein